MGWIITGNSFIYGTQRSRICCRGVIHVCKCVHLCLCIRLFLDHLMQLRGKKSNPLLRALLLSADIMNGRSLNNSLITSSIRQTTRRHNCLPASQILLGWRKQYQEMHMLRRKLDSSYLFCGCYSASIRRRGMQDTILLPSLWFSTNVHSDKNSCTRGWVCQNKGWRKNI